MASKNFEAIFCSEICQVKKTVNLVMQFLLNAIPNLTEDELFDLKLIYSELLINAVVHGNELDSNKTVCLSIEIANNTIYSMVSDEGLGFDYIKLLSNMNTSENLLGETGRGVFLVRSLTDSLSFNVSGNQITFYKRVNQNGENFNC